MTTENRPTAAEAREQARYKAREEAREEAYEAMRAALLDVYQWIAPQDWKDGGHGPVPYAVFAAMTPEEYRAKWDFDDLDRAHVLARALALAEAADGGADAR